MPGGLAALTLRLLASALSIFQNAVVALLTTIQRVHGAADTGDRPRSAWTSLENVLLGDNPLKIRVRLDNDRTAERYIAAGFLCSHGFVFVEPGWSAIPNPGRSDHIVEGVLSGSGPWQVGDKAEISVLTQRDELWHSHEVWVRFQKTPDGKKATRDAARTFLAGCYGLTTEDLRP
jgi:hypothetical protein